MRVKILGKNGKKIVDLNRRRAIRERCLNCSCWYPKEVENCTFKDCQLYPYRLGKGKQNARAREKAIKAYCLWRCADQPLEVRKCTAIYCPLYAFRKSILDRSVELRNLPEKEHIGYFGNGLCRRIITGIFGSAESLHHP